MIFGLGNDMIEIDRIRRRLDNERLMAYCFSAREREQIGGNAKKLAGCFCAKEALSKALGTGVRGFSLDEISVLRDSAGKPYLELEGRIAAIIAEKNLRCFVSLTNTEQYAVATVILEVKE